MSTTILNFDPVTQDPRLLAAFRDLFGNTNLTPGQVQAAYKSWLIGLTRDVVVTYEDRLAKAAVSPPAGFDPT